MSYVAVKGGERAIRNAGALLARRRRGSKDVPELELPQIDEQLALAVDRVMCEGSLYDRELAALAVKQSWGDLVEAIFLVRAFRTTLPRFYESLPLATEGMALARRISSIYKDIPGGQFLGPTFDYSHRLLDFSLAARADVPTTNGVAHDGVKTDAPEAPFPRVVDILDADAMLEPEEPGEPGPVGDLTRTPISFPPARDVRLQALARADEGFLLALGYSTQRGYGRTHPFAGEIRMGMISVEIVPDELGFAVVIAEIMVTEVQMVNQFLGGDEEPPRFTRGYGLTFGYNERKAMAMALVDRAMRAGEYGEPLRGPAQDPEFVLMHADNVEAQGFVQHLKLPHYVDFQAEL
ncbi:MAG TPA: carbon-phosphorus lyase complex subunit PhnI, partial [Candidatus Acidoferrum sp.]|nr:carbon-phosphorus lyase complex subunit PhnI [Candidatus Acidoferrum sp.]